LVYDKFPKRTEDFFQTSNLLEKLTDCVRKRTNLETKSFGLYALSKFCLRKNYIFLEVIHQFLPEVFSLFVIYFINKDKDLWAAIMDDSKLKSSFVRATKNKTLFFQNTNEGTKLPNTYIENLLKILLNMIPNLGSILSPYIQTILLTLCLCYEEQKLAKNGLEL